MTNSNHTELIPLEGSNNLPVQRRNSELVVKEHYDIAEKENRNPLDHYINQDGSENGINDDFHNKNIFKTTSDLNFGLGEMVKFTASKNYQTTFIAFTRTVKKDIDVSVLSFLVTEDFFHTPAWSRESNQLIFDLKNKEGKKPVVLVFKATKELINSLSPNQQKQVTGIKKQVEEGEAVKQFKDLIESIFKDHPNTSDTHLEVSSIESRIRIRVDGELRTYATYPYENLNVICRTAYNVIGGDEDAGNSIDGSSFSGIEPQSAKFIFNHNNKHYAFRVEVVPRTIVNGFDMVVRTLSQSESQKPRALNKVGFNSKQLKQVQEGALKPNGLIIITGPTGGGKSETMGGIISFQQSIFGETKKFYSIEHPVERILLGVSQINIEQNTGKNEENGIKKNTIAAARSLMRADPDIAAVGEIRDAATAELGVELAKTGHPVLATMHTSNTYDVPSRFEGLGIDRDNIASESTIALLITQNLIKTVCPHCSKKMNELPSDDPRPSQVIQWLETLELLEFAHHINFATEGGCAKCNFAIDGQKGRTGIAEVLTPSNTIRRLWGQSDDIGAKEEWLRSGGITIAEMAIEKMCHGIVDPMALPLKIGLPTKSATERRELSIPLFKPEPK